GYAFTINASDAEGDALTYTLTGPNAVYFTVGRNTGVVTVNRALDRENTSVGTTLFRVQATDADTGTAGVVQYSIDEVTPNEGFGLFSIVSTTGEVKLNGLLNYTALSTFYRLKINATDGGGRCHFKENKFFSSIAFSFITVVDVPDLDPQFISLPYIARVAEDSPLDSSVFKVTAIDQDTGVNDEIIYSIEINDINDNKPEFYKCEESGACVMKTHFTGDVLEHSLGSVPINMTVKDPDKVVAIDEENPSFHSTATVTININDANDNSPTFPEDTYKLNVTEHSDVGTEVARITAEDPDTMDQGFITYRLLPDSLPYFDVQPNTGIIYVKNQTLLDREVRSVYSATLLAKDKDEKPGSTVLEITVTDINDQHPVINRESYLVFVEEGGQFEVKIEATDADDPDTANSQIVYGIMPSMYSGNFTIDPNTGVLRNNGILDREALDPLLNGRIELNITATDKGDTPLSTVVPVFITVEDINDNMPHFEASSYKFSVKEGEKAYVGSVFAEDLDQTTDFNRISFSIIDGSFGSFIIRTFADKLGYRGNITVDPDIELDYESTRKQFNLRVEATDLEQKKAEVTVVVDVVDRNDERPEFKPTGPVTVKENTNNSEAIGSFTGLDKDGNHSLVYELESLKCRCNGSLTTCSWFILDPSGEVRVNPEDTVDYEQCDQALMEARVVDEYTEKGENSGKAAVIEPNVDPLNYILLGMVGGLIIVLAVLTTSLLCTRRRKLKAAKAMNSASMVTSDNQKSGPVVPGTNKYTMELNSLDYSDEMTMSGKGTKLNMMIQEEEEDDSRPPEYIEPLGAALAQRGQRKENPLMGFSNPAFSTTDL
uniref:Cadherin domain-containing protein n=1 Tax=Seriola dumerili TaxID=41447 RepID=A0A3B4U353_SERDU